LAVNPNQNEINAASQIDDVNSIYHHHRRLIELRRRRPALVHGEYRDIDPEHPRVFAYARTLADQRFAVLINFGRERVDYSLPQGMRIAASVLDNGAGMTAADGDTTLSLAPWQATVYRLY
jgi:oligo-1,6-glucosidase